MENKKAVIYCRVSTKEQVEEGNSLATQEKHCRDYAEKNGYEVAGVFIEQGESAKTVDRTELSRLMQYCASKKHGISAVIAYKIDRISRNIDDYSQIRISLKRYGVEIKSTSEYFEDTPAGRFMENIIANVAQFDNDVRAERCSGGMKDAVREGRYVWMAPYGYSNVRVAGKATIAPNQFAPFVRKAFEKIAQNILPIDEIRKELIAEGMINPSGKPVAKSHFHHMIRNEVYTGWISKFGERHEGAFAPTVSEQLFNQVQWILSHKRRKYKDYSFENPDFPLRRFFRHPSGKMFTGCWSKGQKKKYPYYLLQAFNINIRKEKLEGMFKDFLNQFRIDLKHFEKLRILVKQHCDKNTSGKKGESEKVYKKIAELKGKQIKLIEKNLEGIISNEFCKERMAAIEEEIYNLNKMTSTLSKIVMNYTKLFGLVRETLLSPGEVWEKASFTEKLKLQQFYFPDGIEFDGLEIRTKKICNLFKLKGLIPIPQFKVVHHQNSISNTKNQQISLPAKNTGAVCEPADGLFWEELYSELLKLKDITSHSPPSSHQSPLDTYLQ